MPPEVLLEEYDRLVLAIDVGSSSIRCSAYRMVTSDDDGGSTSTLPGVVTSVEGCSSSIKTQGVMPNTGKIGIYRENDGGDERCMLDDIDTCVDVTLDKVREKYDASNSSFIVSAVGFSTFVMNLVGIDCDGKPVGNDATLSYACNAPDVARECEAIREKLRTKELDEMYQRTGAPLHSAYALPQLRVFYNNNPELASRVEKWTTLASLCLDRWTNGQLRRGGHCSISYSEASWTGMLNFRIGRWDEETKRLLPKECIAALPLPMDFDTAPPTNRGIHILKGSTYWDRWPELRGQGDDNDDKETMNGRRDGFCRLFLGIGDGACANAGSKCTTLDRIAVSVGTSAAVRIILHLPINYLAWCGGVSASFVESKGHPPPSIPIPQGLFCYRIDAHHVLLGGALTDGGSVVEWVRSIFQLQDDTEFDEVMERVERGYCEQQRQQDEGEETTHRLATVPFLSGERSTGYRSLATGVICGITRETTREEIIASMLEGVVLRLNAILDLLVGAQKLFKVGYEASDPPRIVASGNGLVHNRCWMQMLADCSQIEVVVDGETEATSRGAAFFAMLGLRALSLDHLGPENISASWTSIPSANMLAKWKTKAKVQDALIDGISSTW